MFLDFPQPKQAAERKIFREAVTVKAGIAETGLMTCTVTKITVLLGSIYAIVLIPANFFLVRSARWNARDFCDTMLIASEGSAPLFLLHRDGHCRRRRIIVQQVCSKGILLSVDIRTVEILEDRIQHKLFCFASRKFQGTGGGRNDGGRE